MTGTHLISREDVRIKSRDSRMITYTSNKDSIGTDHNYKHEILWEYVTLQLILQISAIYGFFLLFTGGYKFHTLIWTLFLYAITTEGIGVGAHRYYTHKGFKAKPLLRAILLVLQTMAGQFTMYTWVRIHRLHHRYSDTDADPHNAQRGFFFSHIGWTMTKKHPLIKKLGKQIDVSDLEADWMVMFQKKYYVALYLFFGMLIPVSVPVHYFGESWKNAIFLCYFLRYVCQIQSAFLVNSAAHLYGFRPYDGNIKPAESWFISFVTCGEGWHNYHHAFPWDYKAAELSMYFNFSAKVIRFLEFIGLAWDLRSASPKMVEKRIFRTGDGTHYRFSYDEFSPSYATAREVPEAVPKPEGLPLHHENDVLDIDNMKD